MLPHSKICKRKFYKLWYKYFVNDRYFRFKMSAILFHYLSQWRCFTSSTLYSSIISKWATMTQRLFLNLLYPLTFRFVLTSLYSLSSAFAIGKITVYEFRVTMFWNNSGYLRFKQNKQFVDVHLINIVDMSITHKLPPPV